MYVLFASLFLSQNQAVLLIQSSIKRPVWYVVLLDFFITTASHTRTQNRISPVTSLRLRLGKCVFKCCANAHLHRQSVAARGSRCLGRIWRALLAASRQSGQKRHALGRKVPQRDGRACWGKQVRAPMDDGPTLGARRDMFVSAVAPACRDKI